MNTHEQDLRLSVEIARRVAAAAVLERAARGGEGGSIRVRVGWDPKYRVED